MNAKQIEHAVANRFNWRQNIIVPNISWGLDLHECDLLIMSQSGYLTEVEIKISVSDLKKDFQKVHAHNGNGKIKYLYYAMPSKMAEREDLISLIPEHAGIIKCSTLEKHDGKFVSCYIARKAKARANARALTPKEQFDLVRLGTMRIWNLKRKLLLAA